MVEGEMSNRGKSIHGRLEHVFVTLERAEMKAAKRPFASRSLRDGAAESVLKALVVYIA